MKIKLESQHLIKWFPVRNRWLCLVVYLTCIFLTTCTYYGWQHMQWVLVYHGSFEDQCPPGTVRPPDANRDDYLCDAQADAIDIAYTIASSFEFSGALLAGILYDNVGPCVTAAIGETLHFFSWPFILLSNQSVCVYFGFSCLGLAVNSVAIPAMVLMLRFPKYPFLMESCNLAAQTVTAFTMPVIYSLMTANPTWTWNEIMAVYLPIAACFAISYIVLLPAKQSQIECVKNMEDRKPVFERLTFYCTRPIYFAFVIWYSLTVMQMSMLNVKLDTVASQEVSEYVGWIFWTQAPLGILFGLVNEKMQSLTLCSVLTFMTLLAYLLTIINTEMKKEYTGDDWSIHNEVLYYLGSTSYVIANSYIYTIKYTWITEIFPSKYFGTMTGIVGLSAGIIQTINTAFLTFDDMTMLIGYCCLSVIQFGLIVYIWFITCKKGITYVEPMYYLNEDPIADKEKTSLDKLNSFSSSTEEDDISLGKNSTTALVK
eukprot:GHVH01017277.1.p1 GENE.GHVH01017277.1~~GHVH01017277.1.p1  ORF type:complete len:485 (+),score=31.82 GHVH01017277.1:270-1724(+)